MADLTLATAGKVNVGTVGPIVQVTAPAAGTIVAGAPCFLDTNGKFAQADANDLAGDACFGIATRSAVAGEAVTVMRRGLMDGFSNLPAYGKQVFVSDTVGRLADAAGSASIVVGIVVPVWGQNVGTAADKMLLVECTGAANAT